MLKKSYIPQKKAESIYNKNSARKKKESLQKRIYFFNFLDMLKDPQKLRRSIFQTFCKINFKNGSSGTSQIVTETKSPIMVSLALLLRKPKTYCKTSKEACRSYSFSKVTDAGLIRNWLFFPFEVKNYCGSY